jgi:hypothetical protein
VVHGTFSRGQTNAIVAACVDIPAGNLLGCGELADPERASAFGFRVEMASA